MKKYMAWQDLNGKQDSDTKYSIINMNDANESYSITNMNGVSENPEIRYSITNMNGVSEFYV